MLDFISHFIIAIATLGGFVHYSAPVIFGAPSTQLTYEKTLVPITTSLYDLGTSTATWRNLYTDRICLSGDCQTTWSAGGGEANTGGSLGTGINIFDSKSGVQLRFNTLAAGTNVTLSTTTNNNTIVISSTGGSGSFSTTTENYWLTQVGRLATSAAETKGQLSYWTSTNGTPATLAGIATTTVTAAYPLSGSFTAVGPSASLSWAGLSTSTPFSTNQFVYTNNAGSLVSVASSSLSLPNTALQNSSITINGSPVSLGSSVAVSSTTLLVDKNKFASDNIFASTSIGTLNIGSMTATTTTGTSTFNNQYVHFGTSASNDINGSCAGAIPCVDLVGSNNKNTGVLFAIENTSNGASAYSGINILNDLFGTLTTNFAGMYLTSSNYSDATFGFGANFPNLLQLQNTMGDLSLYASSTAVGTNSNIKFWTAGVAPENERMRIDRLGNVGIASTSPGTPLSVNGAAVIAGPLTIQSLVSTSTTATSSFAGGLSVLKFAQTGTASSTFANGLQLSAGSLKFPSDLCAGKTNGGALSTDASGNLTCTDDDSSAGAGTYPFTPTIYGGAGYVFSATSTGLRLTASPISLSASSSASFDDITFRYSTSTSATTTNLAVTSVTSALHLGGSTGAVTSYAGTSCSNQFIRSLNGAGAATCATVANTDLANSSITLTYSGNVSGSASVSLGGTLTSNGSTTPSFSTFFATTTNATSTILGGLTIGQLNVSSTTASSTFQNGLDIIAGGIKSRTLTNCDTIDTDANGLFKCGTDNASAGGGTFPFTPTTWNAIVTNATDTPVWFRAGLMASTTSYLSTTTIDTKLGIASSSPVAPLTINGAIFGQVPWSTDNDIYSTIQAPNSDDSTFFWNARRGTFMVNVMTVATDTTNLGQAGAMFGDTTTCRGYACFAAGLHNYATGNQGTVIGGQSNTNSADNAAIIGGDSNTVTPTAAESFTAGLFNTVTGYASVTLGDNNWNDGTDAVVIGSTVRATASNAFSFGKGAGFDTDSALTNNKANSLFVGFNSNKPTFIVTQASGINKHGSVGIASTSPTALFGIHAYENSTKLNLFEVGSSTATATTTLFSIDNTGAASTTKLYGAGLTNCSSENMLTWTNGTFGCESDTTGAGGAFPFTSTTWGGSVANSTSTNLLLGGGAVISTSSIGFLTTGSFAATSTATSTVAGGLSVAQLNVSSTTASSTFANGLDVARGGLILRTLPNCDTIDTDANGMLKCGADASGGASLGYTAWGGSINSTYGTTTVASTTPAWFQTGFYASSTIGTPSVIDNFTATNSTTTNATTTYLATANLRINSENFTDLTGTGLSLSAGALTNTGVISNSCSGGFLACSGTNPSTFTITFPWTSTTWGGSTANATSTNILLSAGAVISTSSIGNLTSGTFTATSSITNKGVISALVLNSSTGLEGAYGGSNPCSSGTQAAFSISATGVITCATVSTFAWPFTSTTWGGTVANSTSTNILLGAGLVSATSSLGNAVVGTLTATSSIKVPLTGLLQGNGVATNVSAITDSSTAGQVLRVTGASTYAWGALDLANSSAVTGTLPIASGGTNNATAQPANALVYFDSSKYTATSSQPLYVGSLNATSTTLYSVFSGNLGLSTSTPRWPLTISSSSAPQLTLTDGSLTSAPFNFRAAGNTLYLSTSSPTTFATSTNPIMQIDSTGAASLLIATSSNANAVLGVAGRTFISGLTVSTAGNAVCKTSNNEIVDAGGTTCVTSSARFKHNIFSIESGLDTVLAMRPVSFTRNEPFPAHPDGKEVGFIAEEVNKVDTRLVEYEPDGLTPRAVKYQEYTSFLTKAIQELYAQFQRLLARVSGLESRLDAQQKQIDSLQRQVDALLHEK